MKWKYFSLAYDDRRAKAQMLDNLSSGAREHTLSRKVLARFADATGAMLLIAWESIDLDCEHLYKHATYNDGKWDPKGEGDISYFESPVWGLVEFVKGWLTSSRDAVVVCEPAVGTRQQLLAFPRESRTACYGDNQVYYVLTSDDTGIDNAIDSALHESLHLWASGVCSRCAAVPHGDISSEDFFDGIVANTRHIFTPALDDAGFLVWSPRRNEC